VCGAAGVQTRSYISCQIPGKIVINLARWLTATRSYNAPLDVYRAFAINHEVGHVLGHAHEGCPVAGRPAPVMQQQTLDLHGCVANGWVYVDGQTQVGEPIP
jgi:hypothetical protein